MLAKPLGVYDKAKIRQGPAFSIFSHPPSESFSMSMEGTFRCFANYVPLTPISFLERSAIVYRDRLSIVYGDVKYTWKETLERCTKLACAIVQMGVSYGDVVSF